MLWHSARRAWSAALVALVAIGTAACGSLSDSSTSISKSISSPLESSSRSSSPGDAYREEVRDFTAAYLTSGGDPSHLLDEVATVARKNGVTDWERNEDTFRGIGAGMAKAGKKQAELDAYKRTIAGDEQQARWMQSGYDGER